MKGVKQATLFQSWGNQKKETVTFNENVDTAPAAATGSDNFERVPVTAGTSGTDLEGGIINLCDSFEDGDDELLYQAEETLNLEWNAQGHGQNSRDANERDTSFGNDFETEHGENAEENECNISIGADNFTLTQRQSMCKNLPGFDMCAGKLWIYPTNYPVRDYQYNIVHQSLFKNTMVTLPTGLGKTFIAAVVMYNFYRWYPQGKVVFMAPTKPLVAQQIEACYSIMGIPQDHTAEMTGSMGPPKREKAWHDKRVFFLTPQVLTNDLSRGSCPAEGVKCLVIDEAHKALGNHAYCQVVRELVKYTENFRVLALSATPGSDIKAVQQVLTNLLISHIEIRTEESIDIKQYSHERKVDKVVVPLGEELTKVKEKYLHIMDAVVSRLKRQGVLYNRDTSSLSKFLILKSRDAFRQNPPERLQRSQFGVVEADYALAMSLYHGFELLQLHGSRSLYNFLEGILSGDKGHGRTRAELTRNGDFNEIMALLAKRYTKTASESDKTGDPQKFVIGHPKMEKLQDIVLEHFNKYIEQGMSATRVMIFSQYRDSVQEITDMLNVHRPLVKVMSFIGQSSAGKSTKGFTQKEQLQVMKQFREGGYNTLVSTCVGEEGLDIGDVDLIICFDAHKSPIRLVQRMGRTGRKREGRIVMLVTQGKEEQIYNQSQYSKKSIHKAILNGARSLHFYQHSPRMVPEQLDPRAHKMFITVKESFKPSKRISAEPKGDQNKITSLFDSDLFMLDLVGNPEDRFSHDMAHMALSTAKKSEKDEVITAAEYQELGDWFVDKTGIPALPRTSLLCLDNQDSNEENPESLGPRLSLSEWSPWQNTVQHCEKIDHSMGTKHLVQIMEFIQLQQSLDPADDPYGLEMAAYLNEDDILKPGETEAGPDNILKYCVTNKPEKSSDGKGVSKSKKKQARRSDALKDIEDDHKDDDSSGDDLPAFALSPDKHVDVDNEIDNLQETHKTANGNNVKQVKATEKAFDHEVHGKTNSKNVSSKKNIGSRAKSLERKMSEDILRKSKKRKRSKVSLNHTKIVDLIADNDNNDFDDDGNNHIVNDVKDLSNIHAIQNDKTGYKDTHKSKQTDPAGKTKDVENMTHKDHVDIDYYKVCSPPSIEDAIAHCEGLDDTNFLDRMDMTDILDEDEKENFRKRMNEYDSHKNSTDISYTSYSLDDEDSFWTTKLLKHNFCEEDGFQSFLQVKRENDILLKKLFSDKKNKNNNVNETLFYDEKNKNSGFNKNKVDPKISSDKNLSSVSLTTVLEKSDGKLSPSSSIRPNNSLHLENNIFPSSSKVVKIPSQNDSWFKSVEDDELALACSTQNLPNTNIKDLKPTQVTFTQALACVHSSNSSETDIVSGNPKVVSNPHRRLADSQDSEDSLKNLSTPEFCSVKENIDSTGQFVMKDDDTDHETNKEASFERKSQPENVEKKKDSSDGQEGPLLRDIEQTMSELEERFSGDEADLPQFDLGFDFDEDIIPPSPNATQQSQKGVSKCISQTFSHRLSQSVHVAHVNDDNNDIDNKTTMADSIKTVTNSSLNKTSKTANFKQSLDFSSVNKKPEISFKAEPKESNKTNTKISYCPNLEDIPEFSDNDSDFESEMINDDQNPKDQSKSDTKEKEHEEILKIAEFVSSQEPVDDPSFCLMGGDDLGEWFDSEPEWTENTDTDKCENTNVENEDIGRLVSGMNEKKQSTVREKSLSINHSNKAGTSNLSKICNKAATGYKQSHKDVKELTDPKEDNKEYSEIFNKTLSKLKTPVSKFTSRKSSFTVDDLSPDPFNDSFDFDYMNCSKSVNTMTSLKAKVKPYSVTSSTPKVSNKMVPSQPTANFDDNSKIESPQVLEQKENLQSESESDDSFIVRKKKKPCIIESPISQVEKQKEYNEHTEETPFKTPLREDSKRGKSMNSKLAKKKMSVSFSDDDDFDNNDTTKKKYCLPKSMTIITEGSSDDDFDEPINRKMKTDKSDSSDKSMEQSTPPQKVRKKRGSNPFVEEEAELSDDEHGSSDESEHDLDHYEASFIQDTEQFSQSQGINPTQMQAVYMESVRSPTGPGRFKLQYDYKHTDVFSQIPQEESQYMEDSFCVGEEDDDWLEGYDDKFEPMEVTVMHPDVTLMKTGRTRRQRGGKKVIESGIERAKHQGRLKALDKLKSKIAAKNKNKFIEKSDKIENGDLPNKKSRIQRNDDISSEDEIKRKAHPLSDLESPEIKTKKRRLKSKIFSSSDEEERVSEIKAKVNNSSADFISDDFEKKENKNLTKLKEKTSSTLSSKSVQGASHSVDLKSDFDPDLLIFDSDKSKNISKGVILVDSKEISGSQDIVSDLRFKHSINVSAAQLPGCDYIISNRMAVERKQWSEFSNGANREKLTERIQALKDLYDRPILIVEKDRVKPGEEKHPRPLHWTKYVDKTIALLLKSSVKVLYTDNQKETATLLSDLCQLEMRKGMGISAKVDLNTDKQNKVKYFASLPKLSYIHALNLAHGFKSVSDFMRSSVQEIQTKGQMSENRAVDVYKFLRRQFDDNMLSK